MSWFIAHSAKGTTWKDHQYLKRIDGKYYYPDSYEGGRHLSSLSTTSGKTSAKTGKKVKMTMSRKLNVVQKSGTKIGGSKKKKASSQSSQQVQQTPQINQDVVNQISAQVRSMLSSLGKNSANTINYQRKDWANRRANWKEKPKTNPTKKRVAKQVIRIGTNGRPINKAADQIEQILNSKAANPGEKASANKQKSGQRLTPADQANINAALTKIKKSTSSSNKGNVDAVLSKLTTVLKKKNK